MSDHPNRPLVRGLHHASFLVDDLDAALDFYVRTLGCTRLPRPVLETTGAWLQAGNLEVHLIERTKAGPQPRPSNPDVAFVNHVAFAVTDLPDARRQLEAAGHEVAAGDPALPQAFVLDPSGNLLELLEPGS